MKIFLKKLFKSLLLQITAFIMLVWLLAFAAITWPTNNPSWSISWGKFMMYFNKMLVDTWTTTDGTVKKALIWDKLNNFTCPTWQFIKWFDNTWAICDTGSILTAVAINSCDTKPSDLTSINANFTENPTTSSEPRSNNGTTWCRYTCKVGYSWINCIPYLSDTTDSSRFSFYTGTTADNNSVVIDNLTWLYWMSGYGPWWGLTWNIPKTNWFC